MSNLPTGEVFAIVGTRPEVVKMAPVVAALKRRHIPIRVIGTGQHYNWQMMGSVSLWFHPNYRKY